MNKIADEKVKKYVDELGEEYKALLFEQLIANSNKLEELSVSKLIRLDEEVKHYLRTKNINKRKNKYYFLGGLYVFMGVFIYLLMNIIDTFNEVKFISTYELIQLMSMIVSIIGVCIFILSFLLDNRSKKFYSPTLDDYYKRQILEYEIISKWRELEGLYYDISQDQDVTKGPMSVIKFLLKDGLISDEDMNVLKRLLQKRNIIVHENKINLPVDELNKDLEDTNKIIDKIQNIIS